MSVDIKELKKQIQDLRAKLKDLGKERELTDPDVVSASQMLDKLLLDYEKLIIKGD